MRFAKQEFIPGPVAILALVIFSGPVFSGEALPVGDALPDRMPGKVLPFPDAATAGHRSSRAAWARIGNLAVRGVGGALLTLLCFPEAASGPLELAWEEANRRHHTEPQSLGFSAADYEMAEKLLHYLRQSRAITYAPSTRYDPWFDILDYAETAQPEPSEPQGAEPDGLEEHKKRPPREISLHPLVAGLPVTVIDVVLEGDAFFVRVQPMTCQTTSSLFGSGSIRIPIEDIDALMLPTDPGSTLFLNLAKEIARDICLDGRALRRPHTDHWSELELDAANIQIRFVTRDGRPIGHLVRPDGSAAEVVQLVPEHITGIDIRQGNVVTFRIYGNKHHYRAVPDRLFSRLERQLHPGSVSLPFELIGSVPLEPAPDRRDSGGSPGEKPERTADAGHTRSLTPTESAARTLRRLLNGEQVPGMRPLILEDGLDIDKRFNIIEKLQEKSAIIQGWITRAGLNEVEVHALRHLLEEAYGNIRLAQIMIGSRENDLGALLRLSEMLEEEMYFDDISDDPDLSDLDF